MSIKYVDTNWYPYIIIFVCLLLLCLVILAGISKYEMYLNKKRYGKAKREESKDFYEKNINKNGDRFHRFMAAIMLSIFVIGFLVFWEREYNIKEEFAWTEEERKDKNGLKFPLLERETIDKILQYEEQLHVEWYNKKKGEYIDRKMVEEYEEKVNNIFCAVSEREDSYVEMKKLDSDFEQRKKNYKRLVDSEQEDLSSEKLWKGYEDGVEVCNVYNTSENVFQTGVLAESASENAHKDQTSPEEHLFFAGGVVNQFEQFIEFSSGNIGGGKKVSKEEVCFRMVKVLYRVSNVNNDHNIEMAEHCGLFGYSCSQYLTEKLEVDDPYYLLYIYYSGLSCLKIMPYIEDKDLCKELCHKELERWEVLDGGDMLLYEKEEKSLEIIMGVKKSLVNYIDR